MNYLELLEKEDVDGLENYLKEYDVNKEIAGQSLLHHSVFVNNLVFTKYLIEKGANVNHQDRLGRTSLQIACYFDFVEIAALLLEGGDCRKIFTNIY